LEKEYAGSIVCAAPGCLEAGEALWGSLQRYPQVWSLYLTLQKGEKGSGQVAKVVEHWRSKSSAVLTFVSLVLPGIQ
jgi:hypothetical protein